MAERVDCHPEPDASEQSCQSRGCCWSASETPLEGIPACFFPRTARYQLQSSSPIAGGGFEDELSWPSSSRGPFGNDPQQLVAQVLYETDSRLHLRVTDPNEERWDASKHVLPPSKTPGAKAPAYSARSVNSGSEWGIEVTRAGDPTSVLFNSTPCDDFGGLVFERQFIELSTSVPPGTVLYGLGEHVAPLVIPQDSSDGAGQTFTLFSRDRGTPDHAPHGNTNLYGQHPVLFMLHPDGTSSGIVLVSSNAMDVIVRPGVVTWRVIGGIIDLFVLAGPTPLDVSQQLANLVGRPQMPPYWALGFHLCRWGYHNASYWQSIVAGMDAASLPIDAYWHDIDLFDNHWDFTVDPNNYPWQAMGETIHRLSADGVRYGGIVDPGIPCGVSNYTPLENGTAADLWVRNGTGDGFAVKSVWPGPTYFADWFHPGAEAWWQAQYESFRSQYPGVAQFVWLDMNEPATISDDSVCPGAEQPLPKQRYSHGNARARHAPEEAEPTDGPVSGPGFDPEYPPFLPGRLGGATYLGQKTLPMDSQQYIGLHYDTHSLYGWSESRVTSSVMKTVTNQRPLVISRSSFLGHSAEGAGHWLGDNTATWHDLRMGITGILQFSALYQVPLVGPDTCGFNGATNAELCTRWMGASAMLAPFFRNHNSINQPEQAPFVFGEPYTMSIRTAMTVRMSLLPMWATAFFFAEADGTPPVRPLFFDFPASRNPGADAAVVGDQAVVGAGLMVSPVVEEGATSRNVVFPASDGGWFDFWTGENMSQAGVAPGKATNISIPCNLTELPPTHLRGGTIVPTQHPARNSTASRKNAFEYTAAIGAGSAAGSLFWDDGTSLGTVSSGSYLLVNISATHDSTSGAGSLHTSLAHAGVTPPSTAVVSTVTVYGASGVKAGKTTATANGEAASVTVPSTNVLVLSFAGAAIDKPLSLQWQTQA